jgi:hypothetical protein
MLFPNTEAEYVSRKPKAESHKVRAALAHGIFNKVLLK